MRQVVEPSPPTRGQIEATWPRARREPHAAAADEQSVAAGLDQGRARGAHLAQQKLGLNIGPLPANRRGAHLADKPGKFR